MSIGGEGGIGDVTRTLDGNFNVDEADSVWACVCWKRLSVGEKDGEEEDGRDESTKHTDRGVIVDMKDGKVRRSYHSECLYLESIIALS